MLTGKFLVTTLAHSNYQEIELKIPPNPNAIIAALCDIASAAYALNHASVRHPNGAYLTTGEDIDALRDKLALLESLPQQADNESFTGPRRARGWLASFLVGEVALNFDDKQLAQLKTALNQARSEPLLIQEFEHSMREYRDAELLGQLREMCGYVENGSDTTVAIFQDDATRDWILRVGTDNTILKTKARRYHSSSFHQVIRVAAEKEIVTDEPEPEECKFCGITTTSPCEAPPTGPCEQAINAFHAKSGAAPATPTETKMKRDRMTALLIEVKEKITVEDAKRIITKHGGVSKLHDIPDDRVQAVIDAAEARLRLLNVPVAPVVPVPSTMVMTQPMSEELRGVGYVDVSLHETLHQAGEVLGNQDPVVEPKVEGDGGTFDGAGASGDWQQ